MYFPKLHELAYEFDTRLEVVCNKSALQHSNRQLDQSSSVHVSRCKPRTRPQIKQEILATIYGSVVVGQFCCIGPLQ